MNLRFSLFGLILLVTFAALACGALTNPSEGWLTVVVSLTAGAFIVQVLRAIQTTEASRAAAVGWLFFVSAYVALFAGPWLGATAGPHLLTTKAIRTAASFHRGDATYIEWAPAGPGAGNVNGLTYTSSFDLPAMISPVFLDLPPTQRSTFTLSGHWLFAWLAGWLGGTLATHLWRRRAACVTVGSNPVAVPDLASSRPA